MAKISLESIEKSFGPNKVLKGVSLDIPDGTLVSILGPSGCGKTTLLRIIAGFEMADSGKVFFDTEDMTKVPVNKRNIGMVFQSYALFPHMTVAQNVAYGLEQRHVEKSKIPQLVQEALDKVQMGEFGARKPSQLSGGQQQRVALARALVISPRILLLDECLSALDKKLRVEMQVELRHILDSSHVTTFFVTHDQEEAMTLSDYVVVMNKGYIEQMGTPHEVYEHPRNHFVASFLGKANFFTRPEGGSFAVRPEKIQVSKEKPALPSAREGKVAFVTYSGNITTYNIDCGGTAIIAEQQNLTRGESFSAGEQVWLSWPEASEIPLED